MSPGDERGRPPTDRPANHVHHDDIDSVRQDAEVAWELGYETGYQHALILASERVDELDAIWRPVPRPTYEERVAARTAEMERHAAKLHAEIGTTEWVGLAA